MTVAYDAVTSSTNEFREADAPPDSSPKTISHTPSGTPALAMAFIYCDINMAAATDQQVQDTIASVTYGGNAMTLREFARCTSAEHGAVWLYDLISGVPSGAQNCVITANANPEPASGLFPRHWAWVVTATAGTGSVQVVDSDSLGSSSTVTNPELTMNNGSQTATTFFGGFSGSGTLANVTPGTGVTEIAERIFTSGSRIAYLERSTSAASGDNTYGMTIAVDDAAMVMASYADADILTGPAFIGGGFF